MTNTNTSTAAATATDSDPATESSTNTANPPAAGAHPRVALQRAIDAARPVVAAVRPDQMNLPTPCDEFDVRRLLGHLLFVLHRIAVIGRDGDPLAVPPVGGENIADDAWLAEWDTAAADVPVAWADPAELAKMKVLPFATLPAPVALGIYVSEVTVHTWDLARATGQHVAFADDIVAASLQMMSGALPPGPRPAEIPFADAVAVADDAPLIDRLVAFVGRRP